MSIADIFDLSNPLNDGGADRRDEKADSPFSDSLFGKEGKERKEESKTKEEENKSKEVSKTEPSAKESDKEIKAKAGGQTTPQDKQAETTHLNSTDSASQAHEKLLSQAISETRTKDVLALLATILTRLEQRDMQQTVQGQEHTLNKAELGKTSDFIQQAYAALQQSDLVNNIHHLEGNAALSTFLAQTEAKSTLTPSAIPTETTVHDQITSHAQNVLFEQNALAQFPGNDSLSTLGRQLSQTQAYLNADKINDAKVFLDAAKAGTFADWLKPLSTVSPAEQKVIISDKLTALNDIIKAAPGQRLPIEIINSNFLDLIEANIASQRTGKTLPVELEASRQAVLQYIGNPAVFDHVLHDGKPAVEIIPTIQKEITRVANNIAQQLPADASVSPSTKPSIDFQVISKTIKDSTFSPKAVEIIAALSKPDNISLTKSDKIAPTLAPAAPLVASDKIVSVLPEASKTTTSPLEPSKDVSRPVEKLTPTEIAAPGRIAIEPGAPVVAPLETPQFSMSALNIANRVAYISESIDKVISNPAKSNPAAAELSRAQFSAVNSAPQAISSIDYFKQAQLLTNNIDNTMQSTLVIPADLNNYPASINNNELGTSYSKNISLPNAFELKATETVLTGHGSNLDGANRGPMGTGSSKSRSSLTGTASNWSTSLASSSWSTKNGGTVSRKNSNFTAGSNLSSSGSGLMSGPSPRTGAAGASGASGGGNPLWGASGGFTPSWHHGFLNPLRSGNIAFGINNRSIIKDEEEEDKEEDEDKKNSNAQLWA